MIKSLIVIVVLVFPVMGQSKVPEIESRKVLRQEKDSKGVLVKKTVQIKYLSGWTQRITFLYKKGERGKIVVSYNKKGQIAGSEVIFSREEKPLTAADSQQLLSNAFKHLTAKEYDANEFTLGETEQGKIISVWKQKHRGKMVYTYAGPFQVGSNTEEIVDAVNQGLIPK